ncbi:hypothetical protein [Pontixanthobacter sp. CEM42]|uniref:hypothetical protein n=1 Tax=Pontixanthobacter sp. CEM42 TaxID=2792077 RepID=UPI001ADF539C|nr:hypothetical protein [Pontixanthobacter sp. CEM42]
MSLLAALILTSVAHSSDPQIAAAERLVEAIVGGVELEVSDFTKSASGESRGALEKFASCTPRSPFRGASDPSTVYILWSCKGVSRRTPPGISLSFKGEKISLITLHNADLIGHSDG